MKSRIISTINQLRQNQEGLLFVPIYFFLSLSNLVLKIHLNPDWTNGTLAGTHNLLMVFQYTNNEQSRLFQFLIPEFFHRLFSINIESSYAVARLLFVFLAFVVFHKFLRKWFSKEESFCGVLILYGSMAITLLIPDLQESAPLLMLLFILGLWAIREKRDLLFCILLLLGGGLTNETMLILSVGYFFYRVPSFKISAILKTGYTGAIIALPAFLSQGVIRYINQHQPQLGGGYHLPDNLRGIWFVISDPVGAVFQHGIYIYPFLIFSIFWIYGAMGYPKSPHFLKAMFWFIPLFVAAHLITGIFAESRQMIPLGFILIPMSFFLLFQKENIKTTSLISDSFNVVS